MQPEGGFSRTSGPDLSDGASPAADTGAASGPAVPARHAAFFYDDSAAEYAESVGAFIRAGLAGDDPVWVAVPRPRALLLRDLLGVHAERVSFADIAELGRNPARIIPAIQAFAESHPGTRPRYVTEAAWRSRSSAERREVARHEELLNLALAGQPAWMLCPYQRNGLDPWLIEQAQRAHPWLLRGGRMELSRWISGLAGQSPDSGQPEGEPADQILPAAPAGLETLTYRDEPGQARAFVRERARAAGLREPRLTDLLIAVGELAANTMQHTHGTGTVRVWAAAGEVICEVADSGQVRDPLAGRRLPAADAPGGHGLWVVHQVCDLVEMRVDSAGTTFRLHMRLES